MLTASYEGVNLSDRDGRASGRGTQLGAGNQDNPKGNRGASEIKLGKLKGGTKFIATIEPWHGNQVVVYTAAGERGRAVGPARHRRPAALGPRRLVRRPRRRRQRRAGHRRARRPEQEARRAAAACASTRRSTTTGTKWARQLDRRRRRRGRGPGRSPTSTATAGSTSSPSAGRRRTCGSTGTWGGSRV